MRVLRMFQDEGNLPRAVDPRNQLQVVAQPVNGQFLQLLRRPGIRLDDGRRALEPKMAFELDGECIDLEEGGLADDSPEGFDPLHVMRVVPENQAQLQIGPVRDLTLPQDHALRSGTTVWFRANRADAEAPVARSCNTARAPVAVKFGQTIAASNEAASTARGNSATTRRQRQSIRRFIQ